MTTDPTLADPFSAALRRATIVAHRDAAGGSFLHELSSGSRDRSDYVRLLAQLAAVYGELESVGDRLELDPDIAAFVDPALFRATSIRDDLRSLTGTADPSAFPCDARTVVYVEHLRAATTGADRRAASLRYLAHHYTRYLGDLSGGQMIGASVASALDLGPREGWTFFRFDDIADTAAFKDEYRARLDGLALTPGERDLVVGEVLSAYELNASLLASLAERGGPVGASAG